MTNQSIVLGTAEESFDLSESPKRSLMIEGQIHGESVTERVPSDLLKVVRSFSRKLGRDSGRPDGVDNLPTRVALRV